MKRLGRVIIPDETLMSRIYFLRGQKVMLDKDLAFLYGAEPRRLREQVKRNIFRFPPHFMFQLTEEEVGLLIAENVIPSKQHLGGAIPLAFTEHGLLMVANVLKSDEAIQMSIRLIEIFIRMRELLVNHTEILVQLEKLEKQVSKNSDDIRQIFSILRQLIHPPEAPMEKIGYKTKTG